MSKSKNRNRRRGTRKPLGRLDKLVYQVTPVVARCTAQVTELTTLVDLSSTITSHLTPDDGQQIVVKKATLSVEINALYGGIYTISHCKVQNGVTLTSGTEDSSQLVYHNHETATNGRFALSVKKSFPIGRAYYSTANQFVRVVRIDVTNAAKMAARELANLNPTRDTHYLTVVGVTGVQASDVVYYPYLEIEFAKVASPLNSL